VLAPQLAPPPGTLPPSERPQEQPQATRPGEQPGTQRPSDQTQPQAQPEQAPQAQDQNAPETSAGAADTGATGAEGTGAGTEGAGTEGAGAEGAGGEGAGGGGAEAGLGAGEAASSAGMLGRGDMNNRFNLFDNMSPYLCDRVWFSYQRMIGFTTGVLPNPANPTVTSGFAPERNVNLYRMGIELVPFGDCTCGPNFSIAFQDQFVGSTNTTDSADAWANPMAMLKILVCQSCCGAWSLVLGVQPQTSSHNGELHEKSTRFFPGALFAANLPCGFFLQGGGQFGISNRNDPNTVDYALSLGYWLYGCPGPHPKHFGPWLTGILLQGEAYGKNVLANGSNNPFDLPGDPTIPGSSAPYREPRNVYDITGGGQFLFRDNLIISAGYSFPVSGARVRSSEVITTATLRY
jgi:hypothetical protein